MNVKFLDNRKIEYRSYQFLWSLLSFSWFELTYYCYTGSDEFITLSVSYLTSMPVWNPTFNVIPSFLCFMLFHYPIYSSSSQFSLFPACQVSVFFCVMNILLNLNKIDLIFVSFHLFFHPSKKTWNQTNKNKPQKNRKTRNEHFNFKKFIVFHSVCLWYSI